MSRPCLRCPAAISPPGFFDFAFRDVVLKSKDARETFTKSAREINDEIQNKRLEFKLPV